MFALIGYMLAYFSAPSSRIRYLSDASYWGVFNPFAVDCIPSRIIVAQYDWFWGLKLMLIFAPTIVLLLISYKYGVRNTPIGVLLNGERKKVERDQIIFKLVPKWIVRN